MKFKLEYPADRKSVNHLFGVSSKGKSKYSGFYALFDDKHPGVDFTLSEGSEIENSYKGIVVRKEWHTGMGNIVGIRNGNIVFLYAHLSKIFVKLGQIIESGELIGLSGNTGLATTEPHLHFEVRDITKNALKDMVFDPPFGKKIKELKSSFYYQIDNTNTKKSLEFLALRYFGDKKYWINIWSANKSLVKNKKETIPDSTRVVIPNFE